MKKTKLLKMLGCVTLITIPVVIAPIALATSCNTNASESITITGVEKNYETGLGVNLVIKPQASINTSNEDKTIMWSLKTSIVGANISQETGEVTFTAPNAGEFILTIVATSVADSKIFAEQTTTINVVAPQESITITGVEATYNIESGDSLTIKPTAVVKTAQVNKDVTWDLKGDFSDANASINKLTGEISINPSITIASYSLTIIATSVVNPDLFAEFSTTINVVEEEKIIITNVDASYNMEIASSLTIQPFASVKIAQVNKDVTWDLKGTGSGRANINNSTGEITFNPSTTGSYGLTIIATSVVNPDLFAEFSTTINVTEKESITITNVDPTYTIYDGNSLSIHPKATVVTSQADTSVTWDMENSPYWIYFANQSTGEIAANPSGNYGEFAITIVATSVANPDLFAKFSTVITVKKNINSIDSIQGVKLVQNGITLFENGNATNNINYETSIVANDQTLPNVVFAPIEIYFYINDEASPFSFLELSTRFPDQISTDISLTSCTGHWPDSSIFFVENGTITTTNQAIKTSYDHFITQPGNEMVIFTKPDTLKEEGYYQILTSVCDVNFTYGVSSQEQRQTINLKFNEPTVK